jgi:hypothetical protein
MAFIVALMTTQMTIGGHSPQYLLADLISFWTKKAVQNAWSCEFQST